MLHCAATATGPRAHAVPVFEGGLPMSAEGLVASLRWLSFLVLAVIIAAIGYAGWIALANWGGIAV